MNKLETPFANRKHIGIFGDTNAGKSTLFNQILNQDLSIVSDLHGTTTDPVIKGMELIPYGPVALIDTAGFGDVSVLGEERRKKTEKILERCDYVLYVIDITTADITKIEATIQYFKTTPYSLVFTKTDLVSGQEKIAGFSEKYPAAQFISQDDENAIISLKAHLVNELKKLGEDDGSMISGLLKPGDHVVLVIPIDSAAPKGRLILPQVTFIRNCLDEGVICTVTNEEHLSQTLSSLETVNLVVTDSQIFKTVSKIVPNNISLTSFSMLLARQKGDLSAMLSACDTIPQLKNGDKILMLEACTHNHTHEDIGRAKIPTLLQKNTGATLEFEYYVGYDFPKDLSKYKLAIHCGGCMITKKTILSRIEKCKNAGLPITNYGVILAYLSGISNRAAEVFQNE
ncbi:MAG: [Clostridia bacterium]|nr:[FeFe] hydrogenase H-cluster maturation GTPase HydF [Clostridia bacterium]